MYALSLHEIIRFLDSLVQPPTFPLSPLSILNKRPAAESSVVIFFANALLHRERAISRQKRAIRVLLVAGSPSSATPSSHLASSSAKQQLLVAHAANRAPQCQARTTHRQPARHFHRQRDEVCVEHFYEDFVHVPGLHRGTCREVPVLMREAPRSEKAQPGAVGVSTAAAGRTEHGVRGQMRHTHLVDDCSQTPALQSPQAAEDHASVMHPRAAKCRGRKITAHRVIQCRTIGAHSSASLTCTSQAPDAWTRPG